MKTAITLLLVMFAAALASAQTAASSGTPKWLETSDAAGLRKIIEYEYQTVAQARNPREKAKHLFLLNDAAERFAMKLNQHVGGVTHQKAARKQTQQQANDANRFGAGIFWCEFDADWATNLNAYQEALKLDPAGPYAEEAWWRGKLGNALIVCRDMEGTPEENKVWTEAYTEFLQRFPNGKHAQEARERKKQFSR